MKYIGYKKVEGIIEVVTGLHIGGSTSIIEIGGKDNPVIKHPVTREPYIPGSSLKGKMRSLLEWKHGLINSANPGSREFGEVHQCDRKVCPVCVVFGSSAEKSSSGPTRLIVRDAVISTDYKEKQKEKDINWIPLDITEDKYENTINRITAKANPRNFERVVSGVEFSFEMIFRIFDVPANGKDGFDNGKQDEELFMEVLEGLRLVESDALGGAGSRGSGQVKFFVKLPDSDDNKTLDEITTETFNTIPTAKI